MIDRYQYPQHAIPIFIGDHGFYSLNVCAHAIENNAFFLIRTTDVKMKNPIGKEVFASHDTFDFHIERILTRTNAKNKWLHPELAEQYKYICKNSPFDYIDPEIQNEYPISLRVLRFKLPGGGYECIVTNLPEDEFSIDDIKELYYFRWGIETSFRTLKHVLGTGNFHSKKREYVEMEIWAGLLLYNFCSIITEHAAVPRQGKKYLLQVNYSIAFKACHYLFRLRTNEDLPDVETLINKNMIPIRPGRTYKREKRPTPPFSFLYRF